MSRERLDFPAGFLWGVATAAHQVEGGNFNNQWWQWEQRGKLHVPDTARVCLDWWNRAEEDFDRAKALGLNALRLSVEWSRIEPRPGQFDAQALARYRQMLAGLKARGLMPMVTLHHFTDPLWLAEQGGWLNPAAPGYFARFVRHVVEQLGDHCELWCTINEPNIYALTGWVLGDFPPGGQGDVAGALKVLGQLIRAHGVAYAVIHRLQPNATVGWAQNFNTFDPETRFSPLDVAVTRVRDLLVNDLVPRAIITGDVPLPLLFFTGDVGEAKGTFDYVGINAYYRDLVRFDVTKPGQLFGKNVPAPGAPRSDQPVSGTGWGEVYPQGIARVADELKRAGKPFYVTESGVADHADRLRPWVLAKGMKAIADARRRGADVRGYFHWTLVDNFEWAEGFSTRFGLYALDVPTQRRTARPSAELFGKMARANAVTREMLVPFGDDVVRAAFG